MLKFKITGIIKREEIEKYIDVEEITNYTDIDNSEDKFKIVNINYDLEIEKVIKKYCKKKNIRISGYDHQDNYIFIINTKYYYMTTLRNWGKLMVEIWEPNNKDYYAYARYAWGLPEDENIKP